MLNTALVVVTPNTNPAVTLAEAKLALQVQITEDDDMVTGFVSAWAAHAEAITGRQLMTTTYDYLINGFARIIEIPRPPLQSVTHIQYEDNDGNTQTVDTAVYRVDTSSTPGRVILEPDQSWPTHRDVPLAVQIRFVCGYADSGASPAVPADNVPAAIKNWIKIQCGNSYDHREQYVTGTMVQKLDYVDFMLNPYRIRFNF